MQVPLHRLYLGTQLVVDCQMFTHDINVLSKGIIRWMSNGTGLSLLDIPPSRWWKEGQGTLTTYCVFFHLCSCLSFGSQFIPNTSRQSSSSLSCQICVNSKFRLFFSSSHLKLWSCHFCKCTCPSCHQQDPKICDLYIVDKCFLVRTPNELIVSANEK